MINKDDILRSLALPNYLAKLDNPNYIWKEHLQTLQRKLSFLSGY